ncbi:tubulin-specific chaperone D [Anopheles aquasalis]|uniref:tubulin-specific chaperone D n=1 Tax=Anopheles aquasalis TaxID=42839 RepID=UPI00215A4A21|nr:tubulin-specific chaperone D [Anopheles aquasalis]
MGETVADDFKADDGPQNVLDAFHESDKQRVLKLIDDLHDTSVTADDFEHKYEEYAEILSKYQEQPHLLDRSLEEVVNKILPFLQDAHTDVQHRAAKYLYQICKVRTFKAFVKSLPHEVRHLPSVLSLVERQNLEDWQHWETRYIALLWLSLLVLNPFDLSRLDTSEPVDGTTTMQRLYEVCRSNCLKDDSCTPVAAFLVARFVIRNDVKKVCLSPFLDWAMGINENYHVDAKIGPLAAIASILKHGKREDLLPYVERLGNWVLQLDYSTIAGSFKIYKICIKICQRIGLVLLPPKIAKWRYQRGARSLLANVQKTVTLASLREVQQTEALSERGEEEADDTDDEEVPAVIEEIIERLLLGLKGNSTIVRWSSAKGIGRITNRLPKLLGDEVVSSVIELLNPLEQDDAWHGACLALAELAKRGLLLPSRLTEIVPLLLQALVYDEIQGYRNVGQNIRDAACYMSWAFARAYHPSVLQPFVERIASALLVTTVFDREINCRRAASAAFQESVGRLGNFPHGIDILTTADFFSVAVRSNAFLQISESIASFDEYKYTLIDHLIARKINHWDTNIRELAALAMRNLTKHAPDYMCDTIVTRLFELAESTELNTRHGAVLALGEVINALQQLTTISAEKRTHFNTMAGEMAGQLIGKYRQRGQFKGMSGAYMKHGCAAFIRNCSEAKLPITSREYLESWQLLLDESIIDEKSTTREQAASAFAAFCVAYYQTEPVEQLEALIDNYLRELRCTQIEHKAQGVVSALGSLPRFMLQLRLIEIVQLIDEKTVVPEVYAVGYNHSEMRRDCIRALVRIVETVGFNSNPDVLFGGVFNCYLRALEEYALDNRGDIGSWVREASINALYAFLTTCPSALLTKDHVQQALEAIAKQAVERIDKIRAVAGKVFTALIHHEPPLPHVEDRERLRRMFPHDTTDILWLFPHHTFPLFIELLGIPCYVGKVSAGLILSVGAPTESLHTCASKTLNDYLKNHPSFVPTFGSLVLQILIEKTPKDPLFTMSSFQFLSELLSSSANAKILLAEDADFAEPIFNLLNSLITHTKKHIDSIPVYCALMLSPKLCKRVLSKLVVYLGMLCVNIRRETALKMYETLLVYGDQTCIPEENLDEVLVYLSEEKWDGELEEARQLRNQLCTLMGIKAPVSKMKK